MGREVLAPYLKKGDYSRGVYEANLHVVKKIADNYGLALTGMPKLKAVRRRSPFCGMGIFPLIILFVLMSGGGRGRGRGRGMGLLFMLPFMLGGGFGGGMGGGFGGGGASGGW